MGKFNGFIIIKQCSNKAVVLTVLSSVVKYSRSREKHLTISRVSRYTSFVL